MIAATSVLSVTIFSAALFAKVPVPAITQFTPSTLVEKRQFEIVPLTPPDWRGRYLNPPMVWGFPRLTVKV